VIAVFPVPRMVRRWPSRLGKVAKLGMVVAGGEVETPRFVRRSRRLSAASRATPARWCSGRGEQTRTRQSRGARFSLNRDMREARRCSALAGRKSATTGPGLVLGLSNPGRRSGWRRASGAQITRHSIGAPGVRPDGGDAARRARMATPFQLLWPFQTAL
jgi:hypothetical protein